MAQAGGFSLADYVHSPPKSDLRIVPVKIGAGNINVAEVLLGKDFRCDGGVFVKKEAEGAWETIVVVDTPEWGRASLQHISNRVYLCPPGPHAVVLVLPMTNPINKNIEQDIKAAQQQMELLSEGIWKHTMVLFVHEGELDSSTIQEHLKSAENLLEKCGQRHFVLQSALGSSQIMSSELLQKVKNMVKENNDKYFMPQVYCDILWGLGTKIQTIYEKKAEDMKRLHEQQLSEVQEELNDYRRKDVKEFDLTEGVRKRRGSYEEMPPSMNEGNKNKQEDQKPDQASSQGYFLSQCIKPGAVILLAFFGALMGATAGAPHGTLGVCSGIVGGSIIGSLVSYLIIKTAEATREKPKVPQAKDPATQKMGN